MRLLLVAMALITLYGLGGQFAIFVVTSEIHAQLRGLESANAAVSNDAITNTVPMKCSRRQTG